MGGTLPDPTARVLVAVVPRPKDWHIVCRERWYRIPLNHAPDELAAEYIAFYHTSKAGADRWAVRFYAQILQYRVVQRRELLPDEHHHPRAHDYYYRLDLGPLTPLPLPIPAARLRRITFIMTTFGRLTTATDLRDLWHATTATPIDDVWGAGLAGLSMR